jgi:predicted MPP superfamily phosphohydrolase
MTVWSCVAFVLICAGFTELCVTVLNRLYGFAMPLQRLDLLRRLHDAAILLFPLAVLFGAGFDAPARFLDGRWDQLSRGWVGVFAICSLGLAGLIVAMLTWWLRTRPRVELRDSRTVLSLPRYSLTASHDHRSPSEARHLAWLAAVPGNEQFLLDVNEKTLRPPGWPEALDGFSILHLSDWHFCPLYGRAFYETAARAAAEVRADLIAFTGDLFDDLDCLDWLDSTLAPLSAPLGNWFILGNHDSWLDDRIIREKMTGLGWNDLGGRTRTLDAGPARMMLAGDEAPWFGAPPVIAADADGPRVVLGHTPDCFPRSAAACADVVLAGHNHGGQVILPLIGPVYSPSLYGCRYPSGIYSSARTVMHVSRGLAGRHPLRIGCRPEITRLTIRCPLAATEPQARRLFRKQPAASIPG